MTTLPVRPEDRVAARVAFALALGAQFLLVAASVRHTTFWGGDWAPLLNIGEALAMLGYAVLGTAGMLQAAELAERAALSRRAVVFGGVALALVAALTPPLVSTDVYDYVARGRVEAIHGANPYTTAPSAFPDDPLTSASPAEWQDFVMPYGPIQAWLQAGIAWAASLFGGAAWIGVVLFSLLHATAHLVTGGVLAAARTAAADPDTVARRTLALWLWNPFVLLECVHSAHNEALIALGLAVCCYGVARVSGLAAALGYGFAALTKHGVAPIAPLTLVWAWRQKRLPGYAAGVLVSAVVAAVAAVRYWVEPGGLAWLSNQTSNTGVSIQALLAYVFGAETSPGFVLAGQLFALVVVLILARRVRDTVSFGRNAAAATLVFLLVAMPLFSPWYHLWWLPVFVACGPANFATRAMTLFALVVPLVYLPFLGLRSYGTLHAAWTWTLGLGIPCAALLPWLLRPGRQRTHTE
jgi:hypothetical protein